MSSENIPNSEFIAVLSSYDNAFRLLQNRTKITTETLLYILGEFFGKALARDISATELKDILKETFSIWEKEGFGKGIIKQYDPLTITIKGCHGCDRIPNNNDSIDCKFREGMLAAIIETKMGYKSSVKYLSSYGKLVGKKRCWFVVMENEDKQMKLTKKDISDK